MSDARLNELIGNARAAIVPGEEDFRSRTARGGSRRTSNDRLPRAAARSRRSSKARPARSSTSRMPNRSQRALRDFDASRYDPQRLRAHAERFSPAKLHRTACARSSSASIERNAKGASNHRADEKPLQLFEASHGGLLQNFRSSARKIWNEPSRTGPETTGVFASALSVRRALRARAVRAIYVAVAVFAAVYIALDFNKLYALRYGADLGTYLQTLVNLQHGSSWNYGEWKHHFQVHDSWILTLLVPVVALFPRAQTLIVVQVLAVARGGDSAGSAGAGARRRRESGELARHRVFVDPGGARARVRQLFRERLRSAARLRRRAGGAQARFLAGADLRAAADGAQGRSDSFRALVCSGVRALVGPANRSRALRSGDYQRRWFLDVRARSRRAAKRSGLFA